MSIHRKVNAVISVSFLEFQITEIPSGNSPRGSKGRISLLSDPFQHKQFGRVADSTVSQKDLFFRCQNIVPAMPVPEETGVS